MYIKIILLVISLLCWSLATYAQTPTQDCIPIQGQGWQGCQPISNSAQQSGQRMPLPPRWADRWGAIAQGTSDSPGFGAASNLPSRRAAANTAVADCQRKGYPKCQLMTTYHNQCIAITQGQKESWSDTGATLSDATQSSLQHCSANDSQCHSYYSACSLPVRVQ